MKIKKNKDIFLLYVVCCFVVVYHWSFVGRSNMSLVFAFLGPVLILWICICCLFVGHLVRSGGRLILAGNWQSSYNCPECAKPSPYFHAIIFTIAVIIIIIIIIIIHIIIFIIISQNFLSSKLLCPPCNKILNFQYCYWSKTSPDITIVIKYCSVETMKSSASLVIFSKWWLSFQ